VAGGVRHVARRARRLTLVAVLALASTTATAAAAPQLPDLVADAPGPSLKPEIYNDGGQRLLMRLDGYVHNAGSGALEMRGSNPSDLVMSTVLQRVYDSNGGFVDRPSTARMRFETTDFHNHWHLMDAMSYSLWSSDRSIEVAPSQKVGFCLLDSQRIESNGPTDPVYPVPNDNFCGQSQPARTQVVEGVSAGWRDVYRAVLPFQWVDISDTAPGTYWLRSDADPDGVIQESDEVNVGTFAASPSIVNGYLAQPVDAGTIPADGATAIDLQATQFDDSFPGSPGPVEFEIVTPPSSGSLDKPTGQWFSGSQVHYTASPGQSGPVAFTFAARDATSAFPLNPRTAGVTLTVAGLAATRLGPAPAPLAISGAPASVLTRSVTQLTATGPDAAQGVSWSANDVVGGSSKLGKLSLSGVYTAPAKPPPGGPVTIAAKSVSGAIARVVVRVVQAPAAKAAPSSTMPAAHGRLSRLVLARQRRTLIAKVLPGRSGRLSFVARRGKQRIATCVMRGQAHVGAVCSMRLSRKVAPDPFICKVPKTKNMKLPGVRVTVTLSYGGKARVSRTARTR
jgi:lysyl oxidase